MSIIAPAISSPQKTGKYFAVTALSQILLCDTDMSFPALKGYLSPLTPEVFPAPGN
jgi:hypothetical protein